MKTRKIQHKKDAGTELRFPYLAHAHHTVIQTLHLYPGVCVYLLQEFDFSANEPVAAVVNVSNVRVAHVDDPKTTGHDFFLAVLVDLRVPQNGQGAAILVDQRDSFLAGGFNRSFGVTGGREHDGHLEDDQKQAHEKRKKREREKECMRHRY